MSSIVLTYFDNKLSKDVEVKSTVVLDLGTKLDGTLNIKLFSEADSDIGVLKFPIKTNDITRDGYNLSLDKPSFISKGRVDNSAISGIGEDATFTELVAEIINDMYNVKTNLSYSENMIIKINEELEKVKNI